MMFITPMPPSSDDPDDGEELLHVADHAAEHQRLQRGVPHRDRLPSAGSNPWRRARIARTFWFERPVDVLDPAGPLVERLRQRSTTHLGATMMSDSVPAPRPFAAGRATSPRTARRFVVVGTAVVAVLVLLADLADDRVACRSP
jgi:hypothetical protein